MADMKYLLAKVNGKPVEADEETATALMRMQAIRDQINTLEKTKEELEFQIADFIRVKWGFLPKALAPEAEPEDDARILFNGKEIGTWKKQARTSIDTKELKKAHPTIAEDFSRTSYSRVMRVKK